MGAISTNPSDPTSQMNSTVASVVPSGSLSFPDENIPNYLSISFYTYKRDNPLDPATAHPLSTITLPVPQELKDQYSVRYNEDALGVVGALASQVSGALSDQSLQDIAKRLTSNGGKSTIMNLAGRFGVNMVSEALGFGDLGNKLYSQYTGTIVNPNMSLTFDGVDLRTHQFNWKLVPRTPAESDIVRRIIYQFKKNLLPSRGTGGDSLYILNFPSIVKLEFVGQTGEMIPISNQGCFLKDFGVDYAPDGHSAFYAGTGQPVAVVLSTNFVERAILTSDQVQE